MVSFQLSSEMWSLPLGIPTSSPSVKTTTATNGGSKTTTSSTLVSLSYNLNHNNTHQMASLSPLCCRSGVCRASQMVELFPTVSSDIVVQEARIEDSWGVAETHCDTFFPRYSFPHYLLLRVNRLVAMLAGFSLPVPQGFHRTCFVAVVDDAVVFENEERKFSLNRECVTGILSLDTMANYLPRKGPLRRRRSGIAYISNVAVRDRFQRKGIAKRLVAKAEAQARSWGCRSIALHCDLSNVAAIKLYKGEGFKCIKVPDGANWPHPRISPDVTFYFMMKLLNSSTEP